MNNIVVNQFTPSISTGDGVSQGVFFTQKILISLGYISNIYANHIEKGLLEKVTHIDEYIESDRNVLIYHFSIGHEHHQTIMGYRDKKILAYHNITPAHFFSDQLHLAQACVQGREQLKDACQYMAASYSDSSYNSDELRSLQYTDPKVLPLLVDIKGIYKELKYRRPSPFNSDDFNIIFVGRIVANKCQHQLVDTVLELKKLDLPKKIKLHLIGGISEPNYMDFITHYIKHLGLTKDVVIHGKVTPEVLASSYQHANLFLSLSEHEGFCMPTLEAICNKLPVLAYNCGGISSVVKKETLFECKSANKVADIIKQYVLNPASFQELMEAQQSDLVKFEQEKLSEQLSEIIEKVINS